MDELEQLKNDIELIKQRNARVEADKAWETSLFRKILVAVLTYIVIVLFLLSPNCQSHLLTPSSPRPASSFPRFPFPFSKNCG